MSHTKTTCPKCGRRISLGRQMKAHMDKHERDEAKLPKTSRQELWMYFANELLMRWQDEYLKQVLMPYGKFKVGDLVCKPKGYSFNGQVRSVFETSSGEVRVVAELSPGNGGGMLHIFSENQLEHWPMKSEYDGVLEAVQNMVSAGHAQAQS